MATMANQPISGVSPTELGETTAMTVWPSIAIYSLGRLLGRLYAITWPDIYILRLGNLAALASIPVALVLYFLRVLPGTAIRYRLTNRRIIVQRGLLSTDSRWIDLDQFDAVDVEVLAGQAWYDAGDLVFRQNGREVFRLPAVSRPEAFRHICQKARMARVSVQQVLEMQREVKSAS